eukprot:9492687-Pyramimonas_sp.AAC.1
MMALSTRPTTVGRTFMRLAKCRSAAKAKCIGSKLMPITFGNIPRISSKTFWLVTSSATCSTLLL